MTTHNKNINNSYEYVYKQMIKLSKTSEYKKIADYCRCRSKYYELFYDGKFS